MRRNRASSYDRRRENRRLPGAAKLRPVAPFSALPQAALRLKQGFGRLIRRSTDRGAVVILDNRILGRDYGKAFLDVLPPASRFVGPSAEVADRIGAWLEEA